MKINFSKYLNKSKRDPKGEVQYFLNGLSSYRHFDIVKNILKNNLGVKEISDKSFMWLRLSELEKDGIRFLLYWDEEMGIFFVSPSKELAHEEDPRIERIVKDAIPYVEKYINKTI